jgi:uncharacterized protein YqeY
MTVPASSADDLRPRLQLALTEALRARDTAAVAALRAALAAISNAEAVPPPAGVAAGEPGPPAPVTSTAGTSSPHIAAAAGLGAAEAEPRRLSPARVAAIVQAEIDERLEAAARYESAGHADRAVRLRAQAQALAAAAG